MNYTGDAKFKILLQLLSNSLFDAELDIDLDKINLSTLFDEAKKQTVIAYAFSCLPEKAKEIDAEAYKKWENYSFFVMQQNYTLLKSNLDLDKLLENANIPHCTLKGFSSSYYYNKPHLRQMGDIDFLVLEQDADKTISLLKSSGYVCIDEDRDHSFHVAFKKNKIVYEMHTSIVEPSDSNFLVDEIIKDIVPHAQKAQSQLGELQIPNKIGHAIAMLLHLRRHMRDGDGIGLRHFCDWACFANTITETEWATTFEPMLAKLKIKNMALAFSKSASLYLQMPEKEWFKNYDAHIATSLINDILYGGNFGKSEANDRQRQKLFIDGRNSTFSSLLRRFFQNVYCWKPFFKKYKVFMPIGAIAYFFRTITLIAMGKRYRISASDVKKGLERSQLYNELFKN